MPVGLQPIGPSDNLSGATAYEYLKTYARVRLNCLFSSVYFVIARAIVKNQVSWRRVAIAPVSLLKPF